jgi:hypothetical protein
VAAVATGLLVSPLPKLQAQAPADNKTVAVISIAPVDKLLGGLDYLSKTGGAEEFGRFAALMTGPYTAAMDKSKPSGAIVTMEGDQPVVLGFVPTTDVTVLLTTLKDTIGEPKDAGGGIKQVGEGEATVFIKQEGAYAYLARDPKHLARLPRDPQPLLGGLDKTYCFAARLNLQNIPQKFKDQWIAEMKAGFEGAPIDAPDPAQRETIEKLGRGALEQLTGLIQDSNQITIGWAIDPAAKSTYTDMLYTAVANSKLARQMATLKNSKTNFAGFLRDDAAMTLLSATENTDKEQIAQAVATLDTFRDNMLKGIENEVDDPEEKALAKEVLTTAMDVAKATLASGKSDGGAVAVVNPENITFVAGGAVVDAPKLEAVIKKAVAFAQEKKPDDFKDIDVKFDAGAHGGVRLHQLAVPLPDEEARAIFGEKLKVVIGVGDKSMYVAVGTKAEATLKEVIDKSAAEPGKSILPMQLNIALGPLFKFAPTVEENPITMALSAAADKVKGNDNVRLEVKAINNGEHVRFEVQEGVLKLVGEAVKAITGGQAEAGAF